MHKTRYNAARAIYSRFCGRAGKGLVKRIKHYESVQTHPDKHISNYTKWRFCIIQGRDTLYAAPGGCRLWSVGRVLAPQVFSKTKKLRAFVIRTL